MTQGVVLSGSEHLRGMDYLTGMDPVLFSALDIVGEREGELLLCYIPPEFIREDPSVSVDLDHVADLSDLMLQEREVKGEGTGQLEPVLLSWAEGQLDTEILDGFHRVPAVKKTPGMPVYATLRKTAPEEVTDLRITARTQKTVQFARAIGWVTEAWDSTEWSGSISVVQAFGLCISRTSTGRNLGVEGDSEAIKKWVEGKAAQWKLPISTIYNYLSTANAAAPDLVQEARSQRGGHALENITPGHLKVMAKALPLRYDLQRLVRDAATQHTLRIQGTKQISLLLARAESVDEAREMLAGVDWDNLERDPGRPSASEPLTLLTAVGKTGLLGRMEQDLADVRYLVERSAEDDNLSVIEQNRLRSAGEQLKRLAVLATDAAALVDLDLRNDINADVDVATNVQGVGLVAGDTIRDRKSPSREAVPRPRTTEAQKASQPQDKPQTPATSPPVPAPAASRAPETLTGADLRREQVRDFLAGGSIDVSSIIFKNIVELAVINRILQSTSSSIWPDRVEELREYVTSERTRLREASKQELEKSTPQPNLTT